MKTVLKKKLAEVKVKNALNQKDTLRYLGIGYRSLQIIIEAGELPSRFIGKQRMFTKANLDQWLEGKPGEKLSVRQKPWGRKKETKPE